MIISNLVTSQRNYFQQGLTRSFEQRIKSLSILEQLLESNRTAICDAVHADLGKPHFETLTGEIAGVLNEICHMKKNLRNWMKPQKVKTPLLLWPSKSRIFYEPLGLSLIISPWNYPILLSLSPLVGAIASGCCAILKPSEHAAKVSTILRDLISQSFPTEYVSVVNGGVPETTSLLSQKFDKIFFTGNSQVGQIVMSAAAKNLTPVTLELGGKNPAIICADANLKLAAKRLVWGKFYNSGQTCVCPDYFYVEQSVYEEFLRYVKSEITSQFGESGKVNYNLSRIVNSFHFQRLQNLINKEKIFHGGYVSSELRFIEPTVLRDVSWDDSVMKEEVFGPVLAILPFENFESTLHLLAKKPRSLASYLFSESPEKINFFLENLSFGGGCVNDCVIHLSNSYLPFGGVGTSGIGSYHGFNSFLAFSHAKSIILGSNLMDIRSRYAPYTPQKLKFLLAALKWLNR
ncbi:MAG: hypothetical protein A4S09_03530 [Proteobacteria bacterium SG_bin7]|nr:MAG: hypothetical protein A4S09_03530 [Proteobacteria bacterium SG_bin7]